METKISMKTIYLLLVISIGLIGLGVGSTFAVFTASAEISNPISFSSNLSYTDNAFEIVEVVIPANSSKNVNFTVYNNSDIGEDVNYAAWYIYDGTASDITFLTGTGSNVNDTSSSPSGVIDASSEGINIFLNVVNNTSSDITLTMGVVTNTDDIVLPNYMKIVTLSTVSSYNLTLEKGTGISTIYYKVNGASSYTASTSSTTVSVPAGSTYYYYVVPSDGYTVSSCTASNPCSGTMSTSAVTKSLSATVSSYTVTIRKATNTTTTLATDTVNSGSSYSYDFSSFDTNINYTYSRVSCTNGQVAVVSDKSLSRAVINPGDVTVDFNDKTLTIASVTADTTCTLWYTSSSSGGGDTYM